MKTIILLLAALLSSQGAIHKNDPNGLWVSQVGTQFQLKLTGDGDLSVQLVPDSNSRYTSYEVELKVSPLEINTYVGKGFFVAKVKEGKECRFDTEWQIIVVEKDRIIGASTNIVPDPETCAVKERSQVQLDLKRSTSQAGGHQIVQVDHPNNRPFFVHDR